MTIQPYRLIWIYHLILLVANNNVTIRELAIDQFVRLSTINTFIDLKHSDIQIL